MKSIVGEPFDDYVSKQIVDRQNIHGQGFGTYRDNSTIAYLNARTSWIKLSSGVAIYDGERLNRIGLNNHPSFIGPTANSTNTGLSNFFVLFNGTSDNAGTPFGGIDIISNQPYQDMGQSILNKVAYGIGGTEFGLRPMPGITSCDTKFRNRGSIREGTITIKAFNRSQLEIISLLYLRLGFPMLLEWGHSIIVDKDGKIDTKPDFSISKNFLGLTYKTDNDVLKALEEQRISSAGNYDGMYGRVVNFDWTFNKDGSYDITLKLISIGAVVESFKINQYLRDLGEKDESQKDDSTPSNDDDWIMKYKFAHTIGHIFFLAKSKLKGGNLASLNAKDIKELSFTEQLLENNITSITLTVATLGTNLIAKSIFDFFNPSEVPDGLDKDYIKIASEGPDLYYIRFGELLNLLQTLIPYNTTDPTKPVPLLTVKILDENKKEVPIPMYTENYQLSGDLRVSLVGGYDMNEVDGKTEHLIFELDSNPYRKVQDGVLVGNLNNVYVNMAFILSKLTDLKDKDGKVVLVDFLKSVLEGINTSLGSVNKLDVMVDETNNTIRFYDETPIPGIEKITNSENKESPMFDLYGYYQNKTSAGFIKDFSLKTEITNNLAAMLTIGATANGQVVGEDATAFSRWNKGLKPIINEVISNADGKDNSKETKSLKQQREDLVVANAQLKEEFVYYVKERYNFKGVFGNYDVDIEEADTTLQLVTNYLAFENQYRILRQRDMEEMAGKINPTFVSATSSRGFLPINLSLTMDGLSGMKIFQQIKVDTAYLPTEYPTALKFLIKGLSNKVDSSGWTTSIETVSVPVIDFVNGGENSSTGGGTGNSNTANLPPSTPSSQVNRGEYRNSAPLVHVNDPTLSPIRNAILRVAKGHVGQAEVPGFDNQQFIDISFQDKMRSIGWTSSPTSYWCNWFTDLVWREAYTQVGTTDPKIQNIFKTKLNSRVLPPLTAGVFRTLDAAVKSGFGKDLGGVNLQSSKNIALPKPGDMIIYSSGHVNICIAVDKTNRTFDTIGGNEGVANDRNGSKVKVTNRYWSTQKIKGIVSVIEN
jgi:hypothetical protein